MQDDLIIRPSGIWNSRAPLNDYIQQDRAISKSLSVSTLSLYLLRQKISEEEEKDRSGRQLLKDLTKKVAAAGKTWLNYRRSHGNAPDGKAIQPTVRHLWKDSYIALGDVQEMTVIRLSGMFEAFAQCWTLNYLLARIETSKGWSKAEHDLARRFLPPIVKGHIAGWPQILRGIPEIKDRLSALPHLFTNPKTGEKVTEPLSANLNALAAIQFWRSYRNQAVHFSRLITRPFHEKYASYFAEAMECFGHIRKLVPGEPLPFHDDLYGAMAASHYRAALAMNEILEQLSCERRGHPEAPGPKITTHWSTSPKSPPLLMPGDHLSSCLWITDKDFRLKLGKENGWVT